MTFPTQTGVAGDGAHIEGSIQFGDKIYQLVQPQKIDEATLAEAQKRLSEMPEEDVPDRATPPEGSRIAFSHNPFFVGREQDLLSLARKLKGGKNAAIGQIASATGLGGIGKTQLASEFVHRYGQYFAGGVYWLNFADPKDVPTEIAACSRLGEEGFELETQIKSVLSSWQNALPRLLVFDNCEDENLLAIWRPRSGGSRILVTSRKQNWDAALGIDMLHLGVLDRAESIAFLQKFSPQIKDSEASAIAAELGDLPLALHLAGSFLKRYADAVSPSSYLLQLRDKELLKHESLEGRGATFSPTEHDLHIARTFAIGHDKLDASVTTDRMAISLLCRAGVFAPGVPIAKKLLFKTLDPENEDIDPFKTIDSLERLLSLGLIEEEAEATVVLHRLLADYVKAISSDNKARTDVETALLDQSRRIVDSGYSREFISWQPHLRAVTDVALNRGDEGGADLCNQLGYHLDSIGDYDGARPYYEKDLEIRRKVLGEEHPDTIKSLNNLGALQQAIGDYNGARSYFEKALEICKKVLGEEHPTTSLILNNLGVVLGAIGDYNGAQRCYEKALEICKKVLGEEHPDTIKSLNNLGALQQAIGDYNGARSYFEKALEICKKVLGEEYPTTAQILNNLGVVLGAIGDYNGAQRCYEKALEIRRKVLGEEHPDTIESLTNLGTSMHDIDEHGSAQPYYEKALEICKKVLGEEHPTTAQILNNLGFLQQTIGDYKGAQRCYEKALEIRRKVLGEEHPDTANSLNNLGTLQQAIGDYNGARSYCEKALEIRRKVLGEEHPDTANSLNRLGSLQQAIGDYNGARSYFEKALEICKKVLGEEHPNTRIVKENLESINSI
jgi:tetratricopeptide (TPR) repeat protein